MSLKMKVKTYIVFLVFLTGMQDIGYSQISKSDPQKNYPKTPDELLKVVEERLKVKNDLWSNNWKGKQLPQFSLSDLEGNFVSNETIKNKIIVINFWFIGCKGCIAEFPSLNNIVAKYKNDPVAFLGMALDNVESLKNFLQKKKFDFNILARSTNLAEKLSVDTYPSTLVIDKNGFIKDMFAGSENIEEKLINSINRTLKL